MLFAPQDWVNELTPTQRGILIRETGDSLGDAPPPPSIHGREFSGAEEAGIDLKELWFFDLTGCKHRSFISKWPFVSMPSMRIALYLSRLIDASMALFRLPRLCSWSPAQA